MLGPSTATKLHSMGITNVSTICQDALSIGLEPFKLKYEHAWTDPRKWRVWAEYFHVTTESIPGRGCPGNLAELKSRLTAAAAKSAPNVPRCPDNHLLVPCDDLRSPFHAITFSRACNECKQQLAMDAPGILRCGACQYDCCQSCQKTNGWN